jgi:hypothetical protein
MKKTLLALWVCAGFLLPLPAQSAEETADAITAPYSLNTCLTRAEELFRANSYSEALIFYYEGMGLTSNLEIESRLHFRLGECLEALRRFDFATYHYKLAIKGKLPDLLVSRAIMKLEHLPELAQTEEATRLFKRAMDLYRRRNIRDAIDSYLASLRLMPTLMAQDESGLIDDAVKYLTFLSESKEREPDRLLKLATLLELRGDVEKAIETLQQISIIYPESDQARQAEEKLERFAQRRTAYVEPVKPVDALDELYDKEPVLIFNEVFEFRNAGTISRQLENAAFTLRAINDRTGVPADRFEAFSITLGQGSEQREFFFTAEEGIDQKQLTFTSEGVKYSVTFTSINQTHGYIQDLYGDGRRAVTLFSNVGVQLKIERQPG